MRLSPAGPFALALALAGCGGGDAGWKQYRTETFEESTAYNKQLAFPSAPAGPVGPDYFKALRERARPAHTQQDEKKPQRKLDGG